MELILTLLALSQPTDINKLVDYHKDRLLTYREARTKSINTKLPLIVWVNIDQETARKHYFKITTPAVHVFMKEFPDIKQGIVIGKYNNGEIYREKDILTNYSFEIENFLNPKPVQLNPYQLNNFQYNPYQYCPTGKT